MRAGFRAFPISPRNSERGVANLLQKMRVSHLIISKDEAIQRTASAACRDVQNDEASLKVTILDAPTFSDLFSSQAQGFTALSPLQGTNADDIALILHSSGKNLTSHHYFHLVNF